MAEKKSYASFNEVSIMGNLKGIQVKTSQQGNLIMGQIEIPYNYVDKNGAQKSGANSIPIMVHPSLVQRLQPSMLEATGVLVKGTLQVCKGTPQADGTYKPGAWYVMVTNVITPVSQGTTFFNGSNEVVIHCRISSKNGAQISRNGNSSYFTIASNDQFGDGTSFIQCSGFTKGTIKLAENGWLPKGREILFRGRVGAGKNGECSVAVERLELVGPSKNNNSQPQQSQGYQQPYNSQPAQNQSYQQPYNGQAMTNQNYQQPAYNGGYSDPVPQQPVQQNGEMTQTLNITDDDLPF